MALRLFWIMDPQVLLTQLPPFYPLSEIVLRDIWPS